MNKRESLQNRIRGWFPKEADFPNTKSAIMTAEYRTERERKTLKMFGITNATMVSLFLVIHFLIDPIIKNSEIILAY